jgi:hypothetical protein
MNEGTPFEMRDNRGQIILQKLLGRVGMNGRSRISRKRFDTYRHLKQLKEMLKGGQITLEEYEQIKIKLLTR